MEPDPLKETGELPRAQAQDGAGAARGPGSVGGGEDDGFAEDQAAHQDRGQSVADAESEAG